MLALVLAAITTAHATAAGPLDPGPLPTDGGKAPPIEPVTMPQPPCDAPSRLLTVYWQALEDPLKQLISLESLLARTDGMTLQQLAAATEGFELAWRRFVLALQPYPPLRPNGAAPPLATTLALKQIRANLHEAVAAWRIELAPRHAHDSRHAIAANHEIIRNRLQAARLAIIELNTQVAARRELLDTLQTTAQLSPVKPAEGPPESVAPPPAPTGTPQQQNLPPTWMTQPQVPPGVLSPDAGTGPIQPGGSRTTSGD